MARRYRDSSLYYRAAREASRLEQSGEYDRAANVWENARRLSINVRNRQWSENRSDFCLKQIWREKLKEAIASGNYS